MGIRLPALADFPHLATLCVEVLVSRALRFPAPGCASAERLSSPCLHSDTYPVALGLSSPEQEGAGHKHTALDHAGLALCTVVLMASWHPEESL